MAVKPNSKGVVTGTKKKDKITWVNQKEWKKTLTVNGLDEADTIDFRKSSYKNNKLNGGNGNDTIYGGSNIDIIHGNNDNDTIYGYNGNDILYGDAGNDTLKGGTGNDTIYGGDDNDKLYGEAGNDVIKGGNGKDTIDGGDGNDTLYGDSGNDTIKGGAGDDTLKGGAGDDIITGGKGKDKLYTDSGSNIVYFNSGDGADTLYKGTGNDTLVFNNFSNLNALKKGMKLEKSKNDLIIKYTSKDSIRMVDFFTKGTSVTKLQTKNGEVIDCGTYYDSYIFNTYTGTKNKVFKKTGTDLNDLIKGNNKDDILNGGKGSDKIYGYEGKDTIHGNNDDDYIDGGDGDDKLYGDSGNDTIKGGKGKDYIEGGSGNDTIDGGDGDDTIKGISGTNTLKGGAGIDKIYGGTAKDTIDGGAGDDTITGGKGNDTINGGAGTNTLIFNTGDGQDTILNGSGTDNIRFNQEQELTYTHNMSNNDLVISYGNKDSITLKNYYVNNSHSVKTINNESLNDLIENNVNEIYNFANGCTVEEIISNGGVDSLIFPEETELTYVHDVMDGNLIINYGNNKSVTIENYFAGEHSVQFINGEAIEDLIDGNINEIYDFTNGCEVATITSNGGVDSLKFTGNLTYVHDVNNDDLIINYGENQSVTITDYFAGEHSVQFINDTAIETAIENNINEIYDFTNGCTVEEITSNGGIDTLKFEDGTEFTYERTFPSNDLIIKYNDSTLTLKDYFGNAAYSVTNIDGTAIGTLIDGNLNETYDYTNGCTVATITSNGGTDSLKFDGALTYVHDVTNNDLVINYGNKSVTLVDYFVGGHSAQFINDTAIATAIENNVNEIYDYTNGCTVATITSNGGVDSLKFTGDLTYIHDVNNDDLVINYGNNKSVTITDYFAGGHSVKTINGTTIGTLLNNSVNEIYDFTNGCNVATITSNGGVDSLKFTGDLTYVHDVTNNDLVINYGDNKSVTVANYFAGGHSAQFINGTAISTAIENNVNEIYDYTNGCAVATITSNGGVDSLKFTGDLTYIHDVTNNDLIINYGDNKSVTIKDYFVGGHSAQFINDTAIGTAIENNVNEIYDYTNGCTVATITANGGVDSLKFTGDLTYIHDVNNDDLVINYGNNKSVTIKDYFAGEHSAQFINGTAINTVIENNVNEIYDYTNSCDIVTITSNGGVDSLKFDDDIRFSHNSANNDLIISYGNNKSVTLKDYYNNDNYSVKTIENGDESFTVTQALNRYGIDITGTEEDETLIGTDGDDTIFGNGGFDTINGGKGNNTILFDTNVGGFYTLENGGGIDTIQFNNDTNLSFVHDVNSPVILYYNDGMTPVVLANTTQTRIKDGDEILTVTEALNKYGVSISGTTGNDNITGTDGNDVIVARKGNDTISGGKGNNTYAFFVGDGTDIIENSQGTDKIDLVHNAPLVINFSRDMSNNNLKINYGENSNIILKDYFVNNSHSVKTIILNEVEQSLDDLIAASGIEFIGTVNNDTITGSNGNDTVTASSGNDTIDGGEGSDTLIFTTGDGNDTLTYDENDTLKFTEAVDLQYTKNNNSDDLIINYGTNDSITIKDYFSHTEPTLPSENIDNSDATVIMCTSGNDKYQYYKDNATGSENIVIDGLEGDDDLAAGVFDDSWNPAGNVTIYGRDGNDYFHSLSAETTTVIGGKGNDRVRFSSPGLLTCIYNNGDGDDILEGWRDEEYQAIQLKFNDTNISGLIFDMDGEFPVIRYNNGQDSVTIGSDYYKELGLSIPLNKIKIQARDTQEWLILSEIIDGTININDYIVEPVNNNENQNSYTIDNNGQISNLNITDLQINGTDDDDIINGYNSNDTIIAGTGDDIIDSGVGNNTLIFTPGDGKDIILNGNGTDTVSFTGDVDLKYVRQNGSNDLVITYTDNDSVTLKDYFVNNSHSVTTILNNGVELNLNTEVQNCLYINGTEKSDYINSTDANEIINAYEGNDSIYGYGGNDVIFGGAGDDTIYAGTGNDTIDGGTGNNIYGFNIGHGTDTIINGEGTDKVVINSVQSVIPSFSRNMINSDLRIDFGSSPTIIYANSSIILKDYFVNNSHSVKTIKLNNVEQSLDDLIAVNGINIILNGEEEADKIIGSDGSDTIINNGTVTDNIDGGLGNDKITNNHNARNISGRYGNDTIINDGIVTVSIEGQDGDDNITNNGTANIIYGGYGNDTITNNGIVNGSINCGYGNDTVITTSNSSASKINIVGGVDTLYLNSNINNLSFLDDGTYSVNYNWSGDDVIVDYDYSNSRIIIKDYNPSNNDILVRVNGHNLASYVSTNKNINGTVNDDVIESNIFATNIDGLAGNDIITNNGVVSEWIRGGDGDDTIVHNGITNAINGEDGDDNITNNGIVVGSINGGDGNDTIMTTINSSPGSIFGQEGNDTIINHAIETSLIDGGTGDDNITSDGNITHWINGGDGNDTITNSGIITEYIAGGLGNDIITNNETVEYIYGEEGNDTITNNGSTTYIDGGSGDDIIINNGTVSNRIDGGTGNDTIYTGTGTTTILINKGDGNDVIYHQGEKTTIQFADPHENDQITSFEKNGNDLVFTCTHAIINGKIEQQATSEVLTIKNYFNDDGSIANDNIYIEHLQTIKLSDTIEQIRVNGVNNVFQGTKFNDIIDGNTDDDIIIGGAGNDTIYGDSGNNTYVFNTGDGQDTIVNGTGNDTIQLPSDTISYNKNGDDLIVNYGTNDTVTIKDYFLGTASTKYIKIGNTTSSLDDSVSTIGISINGTDGDDTINGTNLADRIDGKKGSDTIHGGAGNDTIYGGSNDFGTVYGVPGNDTIYGEDGDDYIETSRGYEYIDPFNEAQTLYSNNYVDGGNGNDTIVCYNGDNTVIGGLGNDTITCNNGNNIITGNEGNDIITVGIGTNNITGGTGNDTIIVSNGVNTLNFNSGDSNDNVTGGTDSDTIKFNDYDLNDLKWEKSGNNLVIKYGEEYTDSVTLNNYFNTQNNNRILVDNLDHTSSILDKAVLQTTATNGGTFLDDVYTLTASDLNPTIVSTGGNDTLYFENTTMEDLAYRINGNDLCVGFNKVGGQVRNWAVLKDYLIDENHSVKYIKTSDDHLLNIFEDCVVTQGFTVANNTINGSRLRDRLTASTTTTAIYGREGNDIITGSNSGAGITISGGKGDDSITVGTTPTTLLFNDGDGDDIVTNYKESDTIEFTGTDLNSLIWSKNNEDLVIAYNDGNVILKDYFFNPQNLTLKDSVGTSLILDKVLINPNNNVIHDTSYWASLNGADLVAQPIDYYDVLYLRYQGGSNVNALYYHYGDIIDSNPAKGEFSVRYTYPQTNDVIKLYINVMSCSNNPDIFNNHASVVYDYIIESSSFYSPYPIEWRYINLFGGDTNNILIAKENISVTGGKGDDYLYGGYGSTFVFNKGDGNDILYTTNSSDTLQFNVIDDFTYEKIRDDLLVRYNADSDSLLIKNHFTNESPIAVDIDTLSINGTDNTENNINGTTYNDIINGGNLSDTISGLAGNDTIYGNDGNDSLDGGVGNDTLNGGTGNNTYVFNTGDGQDIILNGSGTDTVQLSTQSTLRFLHNLENNDLVMSYGEGDTITLQDYYVNNSHSVQTIKNGDEILTVAQALNTYGIDIVGTNNNYIYFTQSNHPRHFSAEYNKPLNIYFDKNFTIHESYVSKQIDGGHDGLYFYYTYLNEDNIKVSDSFVITGPYQTSSIKFIYADNSYQYITTQVSNNYLTGSNDNDLIIDFNDVNNIYTGNGDDVIYGLCGKDNIVINGTGTKTIKITRNDQNSLEENDTVIFDAKPTALNIEVEEGITYTTQQNGNDLVVTFADFPWSEEDNELRTLTLKNLYNSLNAPDINDVHIYNKSHNFTLGQIVTIWRENWTVGSGEDIEQYSANMGYPPGLVDYLNNNNDSNYSLDEITGIDDAIGVRRFQINKHVNVDYSNHTEDCIIEGSQYCDCVSGGSGNDTIYGFYGGDFLYGNDGDDILYGGEGHNQLYGESGNDTYINSNLRNNDYIEDSSGINDKIVITEVNKDDLVLYFNIEVDANGNMIEKDYYDNPMYIKLKEGMRKPYNGIEAYGIETVTTADGYFLTTNKINQLCSDVAGWLHTNGFESVQQILDSNNETDINNLIAQFQTANWQQVA